MYTHAVPSESYYRHEAGMEIVQDLVNDTVAGFLNSAEKLHPPEAWWSRYQPFFAERCGYMMRPRYHPNWTPSWFGTSKDPQKCEDSIPMPVMRAYHWMDVLRMADGQPVMLKRVHVPPPDPATAARANRNVSRGQSKYSARSGRYQRHPYPTPAHTEVGSSRANSVNVITMEEKALRDETDPQEVQIVNFFGGEALENPLNHSVPLLDIFDLDGGSPGQTTDIVLAMPLLRPFNDPPFLTVGEGLEFIKQALDAVNFFHFHYVAHRNCSAASFVYDPSILFPEGYHPVLTHMTRDLKRRAKHYSRTEYPPRYYITNFDYARQYERFEGILEKPVASSDTSVPEFQGSKFQERHDPFATDVYLLGNMLRNEFIKDKHGFEFLLPLIDIMTQRDPIRRPTMQECVDRFASISGYQPKSVLRKRFISGPEAEGERIKNKVSHIFRNVKYSMLGIPPAYAQTSQSTYPSSMTREHRNRSLKREQPNYQPPDFSFEVAQMSLYPAPQRAHSFSHPQRAREFTRQQGLYPRTMETASYDNRGRHGSKTSMHSSNHGEGNLSRASSSRNHGFFNHYPGENRTRTASDSDYYYGPNSVISPKPTYPLPIFHNYPYRERERTSTEPFFNIETLNIPPSTPLSKRATPMHTPVRAQKYDMTSPGAKVNGGYRRDHARTNTNGTNMTENTEFTQTDSISSVTQTQETYIGNGNAPPEANADVSHLDLEQNNRLSVVSGRDTPRQNRRQKTIEQEEVVTQIPTPKPEERKVESKSKSRSKSKSNTIDSIKTNDYSLSKSPSQSKRTSKNADRSTTYTRDTTDFKLRFPEIGGLTPLLSPSSPFYDRASLASSNVPASLLTGPALVEREGSIHSIPDAEPFEIEDPSETIEKAKVRDGDEAKRESNIQAKHEHPHKHSNGRQPERSQTDPSAPKTQGHRSTKWDCPLCMQRLPSKAASIAHMARAHPTYHVCFRCASYFTSVEHLRRHQVKRRHTSSDNVEDRTYAFPSASNYHHQPF